jgi:hypothetical protein
MSWRVARSLDVLLNEINAAAPHRNKASDGSIGDAAHATRTSDHNPWVTYAGQGIVRARDFTHDPATGCDCHELAHRLAGLLAGGAHPALRSGAYIIWQRRILSFDRRAEGWRPYSGSNPHEAHMHLSVATDPAGFDSTQPWGVMVAPTPLEDDMALDDKVNDDRTVRQVLRRLDNFITRSDQRHKAMLNFDRTAKLQLAALRQAVEQNADKAEIKALLNNLDATIQIVVNDHEES